MSTLWEAVNTEHDTRQATPADVAEMDRDRIGQLETWAAKMQRVVVVHQAQLKQQGRELAELAEWIRKLQ